MSCLMRDDLRAGRGFMATNGSDVFLCNLRTVFLYVRQPCMIPTAVAKAANALKDANIMVEVRTDFEVANLSAFVMAAVVALLSCVASWVVDPYPATDEFIVGTIELGGRNVDVWDGERLLARKTGGDGDGHARLSSPSSSRRHRSESLRGR